MDILQTKVENVESMVNAILASQIIHWTIVGGGLLSIAGLMGCVVLAVICVRRRKRITRQVWRYVNMLKRQLRRAGIQPQEFNHSWAMNYDSDDEESDQDSNRNQTKPLVRNVHPDPEKNETVVHEKKQEKVQLINVIKQELQNPVKE